jgi:hypothetical protein
MIHAFWDVTFCHWINSSHHFEGTVIFSMCGTIAPMAQRTISGDLNLPSKCRYLSAK